MAYDRLLKSRRIRKEAISRDEVVRALDRAERDLRIAEKVMREDWDWGFAITYNAVLQASRAYVFAEGYRPASVESHKNVFAFMREALGSEYESVVTYFDRMRNKRHRAVYDVVGAITETEAKNLFAEAKNFVAMIRDRLQMVIDPDA